MEPAFPELIRSFMLFFHVVNPPENLSYNRLSGKESRKICISVYYIKIMGQNAGKKKSSFFPAIILL
ncbi:hypothetical protein CE91St58_13140 [Lachnospiraceae bacterium]|nr:hypothetical protein CE91St58_13140 [Lachnospiraceae bacterium]